jgi:hypothetical protein
MELRTDRLGVLLDQLGSSYDHARERLDGLSNEEYLWEPALGAWSVRPRRNARTPDAFGPGDWVLDFDARGTLGPEPVTTIAWRLGHLASTVAGRWEWTFGDRSASPDCLIDFSPFAERAMADLWAVADRWRASLEELSDEELDTRDLGRSANGLDPQLPLIALVWWTNRAFITHVAEAAVLRDLWRARVARDQLEEAVGRRW